ncbi:MAG TPA: response regulator transcription factor [Epulopiscium sp.]|nr:response regulator transcription factor [Candidatus Epulonipiscium sp.]
MIRGVITMIKILIADDYIIKPFSPGEVMARVRAIMRRIVREEKTEQLFTFGNLEINLDDYTVFIQGNNISLTKKEFEILWTLATNKNMVFSRESLLTSLWGYDYCGDSRTVDTHIKRLKPYLLILKRATRAWVDLACILV